MVKTLLRILLFILLFLPLIAVAHFIIFPQETRCILIEFADFDHQQNIYYRKEAPATVIQQLTKLKSDADKKVSTFWKDSDDINYKLICCQSEADYQNYGSTGSPAVANIKLGAYVVIPKDMFDINILSHEISHTVLYRKIGWYRLHFKIPTWFDEGLAMQVDDRDYYSADTLLRKKASGLILPNVRIMDTPDKFHRGSTEQIILNYATAKYIVHEWLAKNSLNTFIKAINKGDSFEQSYYGK